MSDRDARWLTDAADRIEALEAALGDMIELVSRNVYPRPDVPDDHPFARLLRAEKIRKGGL